MNEAEIMAEHAWLLGRIARDFYFPGADADDVYQEAAIGMLNGIRTYNGSGTLWGWLAYCTRMQVMTALTAARRGKQLALTHSARVTIDEEGEHVEILDMLPTPLTIDRIVEGRDELATLCARMERLSPLERKAVATVANGVPYIGDKSIDNALQRARRKLAA